MKNQHLEPQRKCFLLTSPEKFQPEHSRGSSSMDCHTLTGKKVSAILQAANDLYFSSGNPMPFPLDATLVPMKKLCPKTQLWYTEYVTLKEFKNRTQGNGMFGEIPTNNVLSSNQMENTSHKKRPAASVIQPSPSSLLKI